MSPKVAPREECEMRIFSRIQGPDYCQLQVTSSNLCSLSFADCFQELLETRHEKNLPYNLPDYHGSYVGHRLHAEKDFSVWKPETVVPYA